jgi:hypothetical protein
MGMRGGVCGARGGASTAATRALWWLLPRAARLLDAGWARSAGSCVQLLLRATYTAAACACVLVCVGVRVCATLHQPLRQHARARTHIHTHACAAPAPAYLHPPLLGPVG